MTELETRLRTILSEKEEKLLPENLKKGVTFLGVEGSLEGGSSDNAVKLFSSITEMNSSDNAQIGDTGIIIDNTFNGAYKYSEYDAIKLPRLSDMTVNSATSATFGPNYNIPIDLTKLTPILDNIITTDDLLNGSGALTVFQTEKGLHAGFVRRNNEHNLGLFGSLNRGAAMNNDKFLTIGSTSDTNGAFMRYYKIDLENQTFEKQTDISGSLLTSGSLPVYVFSLYHTTFPIMYSESYDEMSNESTGYKYGWTELVFNFDGSKYDSGISITKNDEILFYMKEWQEYIPDIYNEALHNIDSDTIGITFEKQSFSNKGLTFPGGVELAEDINGQTPFYPYADADDVVDAGLLVNGTTFYYYFEVPYWYPYSKLMNFIVQATGGNVYPTPYFKCYGKGSTMLWISENPENNYKLEQFENITKLILQNSGM